MRYISLCFFSVLILSKTLAQNIEFSPLSRFGIGDLTRNESPFSSQIGHAGIAYSSEEDFNFINAASLGFLKITDAEIGFNGKYKDVQDYKNHRAYDWSGNLNHIQLGIPLRNTINELLDRKEYKRSYGLSFGLSPYTATGYHYVVSDSSVSLGKTSRTLDGSGGINKFTLGFGYRYKNLGVGINLGYLFGNTRFEQVYSFDDLTESATNYLDDQYHATGVNAGLGFLYKKVLNAAEMKKEKSAREKVLQFGLQVGVPSKLNYKNNSLHRTKLNLTSSDIDTILLITDQKSTADLPLTIQAGLYYNHKEKSALFGDVLFENWDAVDLYENAKGTLANVIGLSIGGWIRPDATGYGKFLKRNQYRVGAFYRSGYLSNNDKNLNNIGFTFGVGMPFVFQRQTAMVHLGFELGKTTLDQFIKENYFKINLGFRLNDNEWFLKRRYN